MFGKVRKWLGIEGLKLALILPEDVEAQSGLVSGKIKFFSTQDHTIRSIKIRLVERYTKGRKDEKTTEEFELGETIIRKPIRIPANKAILVSFELPFELVKSEMDNFQEKNIIFGQLVKAAKWMSNVSSEYRVEAEVEVVDSPLNSFDSKLLVLN